MTALSKLKALLPGKSHQTCPRCGKPSFWVSPVGAFGCCFSASCKHALKTGENPTESALWGLFQESHEALLQLGKKRDLGTVENPTALRFLYQRKVSNEIIKRYMVGVIPSGGFNIKENSLGKTAALKEREYKLFKTTKGKAGWLAFWLTSVKGEITSVIFRNPKKKRFVSWQRGRAKGLFGLHRINDEANEKDLIASRELIVTESTIGILSVQSAFKEAYGQYIGLISLGSSSGVDTKALFNLTKESKSSYFVADRDSAGQKLTVRLGNSIPNLKICSPEHENDLEEYLLVQPEKKEGLKRLLETATTVKPTADVSWATLKANGTINIIKGTCSEHYFEKNKEELIYSLESFWQWEGQVWEKKKDIQIKKRIREYISGAVGTDPITAAIISDIHSQVGMLSYKELEFDQRKDLIALQNGVLDTKTLELVEHEKLFYQTILLPFDRNPEAQCQKWFYFLDSLELEPETLARIQEWFGYCLIPDTRIEKCLYLLGDGSNGKSVILETLGAMLGPNTVSIEPSKMFDRFQLLGLQGKLVNYCTDIATRHAMNEEFKKVVSGEQVTCDVKNKEIITFKPFAKHLFSANDVVISKDKSDGFFRRFDVLRLHKQFPEDVRDEGLKEYLKENELPGIFNWSLEGLRRLKEQNFKMTNAPQFDQASQEFRMDNNPVAQFLEDECSFITADTLADMPEESRARGLKERSITTKKLMSVYLRWCQDNNNMPLSNRNLGKQLLALPECKKNGVQKIRPRKKDGKREHVYLGLELNEFNV